MISKKMLDLMNKQINEELFSSYLYLSMAAHANSLNLPGFAQWFRIQAQEELSHAMKFFEHINDRGEPVLLDTIKKPDHKWASPLEMFKATYEHEQHITGKIHDLAALAQKESDFATFNFLQWFITEQVEEEASASAVLEQLKMIGESKGNLFMLDHRLGARGAD